MDQNRLIKVVVVCSSQLLRTSFKMLLQTRAEFAVVGEAASLEQAVANFEQEKPDVILFDLTVENENELPIFATLLSPNTSLIVLTNSNDFDSNQKFLTLNIRGSVAKSKSSSMLFKAIKKVAEGEFWFERAALEATIKSLFAEKKAFYENPELIKIASLTAREKEVLTLVGFGLKNKGIAERLFISENTVRHHFGSIFEKLKVSSRLELVVYALKHHLVKLIFLLFVLINSLN